MKPTTRTIDVLATESPYPLPHGPRKFDNFHQGKNGCSKGLFIGCFKINYCDLENQYHNVFNRILTKQRSRFKLVQVRHEPKVIPRHMDLQYSTINKNRFTG